MTWLDKEPTADAEALTHKGFVYDLLGDIPRPVDDDRKIALAQVHATMALVEAIDGWEPPGEVDETVPPEETAAGFSWPRG